MPPDTVTNMHNLLGMAHGIPVTQSPESPEATTPLPELSREYGRYPRLERVWIVGHYLAGAMGLIRGEHKNKRLARSALAGAYVAIGINPRNNPSMLGRLGWRERMHVDKVGRLKGRADNIIREVTHRAGAVPTRAEERELRNIDRKIRKRIEKPLKKLIKRRTPLIYRIADRVDQIVDRQREFGRRIGPSEERIDRSRERTRRARWDLEDQVDEFVDRNAQGGEEREEAKNNRRNYRRFMRGARKAGREARRTFPGSTERREARETFERLSEEPYKDPSPKKPAPKRPSSP